MSINPQEVLILYYDDISSIFPQDMLQTLIPERRVVISILDDVTHGSFMKAFLEKAFNHFGINDMIEVKLVGAIPEVSFSHHATAIRFLLFFTLILVEEDIKLHIQRACLGYRHRPAF